MNIRIKNGRVIDPATKTDNVQDLFVKDGMIAVYQGEDIDQTIDASGCFVMPGFIDLHVHLREPGFEYKETIKTGTLAAAKGGFTGVCPMPNTKPATDSKEMIEFINKKAKEDSKIHVYPVGAITLGQDGTTLTDIKAMKEAGAVAISEDGKSVMDAELYKEAMKLAAENDLVVMAHCEDKAMVGNGCINEGAKSKELGVPGITNEVEDIIVERDINLARETGAKLHLCHCSTKDSVRLTKKAKEEGLPVTAEVCPHHFMMTDEDIVDGDSNYKMNPPLRSKEDVLALKEGLRDNIMDVISTDHAPHGEEEKKKPLTQAPFGIVGSETAVALTITHLVHEGYLTPMQMAEKMSYNPAKIIGVDRGTLQVGKAADIVIIDPEKEYVIDPETFVSKGKNMPFSGMKVKGQVMYTICSGEIVYQYQ